MTDKESEPEKVTGNNDAGSNNEDAGFDKDEDMINYEDEESVLARIDYDSDVDMESLDGDKEDEPIDA